MKREDVSPTARDRRDRAMEIKMMTDLIEEELSSLQAQIEFLTKRALRLKMKLIAFDPTYEANRHNEEKVVIDCVDIDEEYE